MSERAWERINFIRARQQNLSKARKQDQLLARIMWSSAVILMLVSGGLWWWSFQSEQELLNMKANLTAAQKDLLTDSQLEAEYLISAKKIDVISEILQDSSSQVGSLQLLADLITPGISYDQVSFSRGNNQMSLRVTSIDLASLDAFLQSLRSLATQKRITAVLPDQVQRNTKGQYQLGLTLTMAEAENGR